jgi:hypothetical protein
METKICRTCGKEKPISEFKKKSKNEGSGVISMCKLCDNLRARLYRRTLSGHLHKIYNNQKTSSIRRGHKPPTYTFDELKDWFISQPNWEDLWLKWESSGYDTNLAPSIDRLDESKGYCFNNIRLVTWQENNEKEHHRQSKKVNQYTLDGKYIKTWNSITDALKALGKSIRDSHISLSCKGEQNHTFGYQWRYLSDEFPEDKDIGSLPTRERVNGLPKKVKAILPNGKELIFNSLAKAGKHFNCSREAVTRKMKTGRTRITELKDVKFEYYED